MLDQRQRRWSSITSELPMYRVIWVVAFLATEGLSVTRIAVQANTGKPLNALSMSASVEDVGPTLKQ